jgi:transposase InsO family protein
MGLKNASAAWQRVMDDALAGLPGVACYADDLCVYTSGGLKEHLELLNRVFARLAEHGIGLHPGKCRIACRQIPFLGHMVSEEGCFPQHSKVEAVLQMPAPADASGVRRFCGMVQYYGKFIQDCGRKRKVLNELTGLGDFKWEARHEAAFNVLKQDLVSAPVLRRPDWSKRFIIHTDWSCQGIGAVLAQLDDEGNEYVVEYASRSCNPAESNYSSYEGECLALWWAIGRFRYYVFGREFTVVSDHKPLEWLLSTSALRGKLARWAMWLSEYDFTVLYREGVKHVNADCLSRHPVGLGDDGGDVTPLPRLVGGSAPRTRDASCAFLSQVGAEQQMAAWMASALGAQVAGVVHEHLQAAQERSDPWEVPGAIAALQQGQRVAGMRQYVWHSDKLWRWMGNGGRREVPPPAARDALVQDAHERSGHFGRDKVYSMLMPAYYWPRMVGTVVRVLRQCVACDRVRQRFQDTSTGNPVAASPLDLRPLPMHGLFYRWHIDLAGDFEESVNRKVYVVVMVEAATKWIELVAIPSKHAKHVAAAFNERVLTRFAAPAEVCSDNGAEFQAEFEALLQQHDIDHRLTSSHHPQANGLAERIVLVVKSQLRKFVLEHGRRAWDTFLPRIELGYRMSRQRSTGYSPYELVYGRAPIPPAHLRATFEAPLDFDSPAGMWQIMTERAELLAVSLPAAMANIEIAQHRDVMRYRRKRAGLGIPGLQRVAPGDFVWVQQETQDTLDTAASRRILRVLSVGDDGVVVVQGADGSTMSVRAERVAPCGLTHVTVPDGYVDPDLACVVCGDKESLRGNPILVCGGCERGWHKLCIQPPLRRLPRGDWFCTTCQRVQAFPMGQACAGQTVVPLLALVPTVEAVAARLQWGMPGEWPASAILSLTHAYSMYASSCRASTSAGRLPFLDYGPLMAILDFRGHIVFDPWAECGHTSAALQSHDTTVLCTPLPGAPTGVLGRSAPFQWDLYRQVATLCLPAGFCIVTAPTAVFNLLDLVLPMLVRLSPVVCMLVPRTYVVDGLAPRQQWLQSLEALGRLHLVAGASARSHAHEPHLWLVIFWDNSTRLQMLAQELHQTSASFQFVV